MLRSTLPKTPVPVHGSWASSSRSASARRRQQRAALRCCASEGEAAAGIESLQKHIKSAEGQARTIDGQQFIPLSSAKVVFGRAVEVEETLLDVAPKIESRREELQATMQELETLQAEMEPFREVIPWLMPRCEVYLARAVLLLLVELDILGLH
ncbi:hypothetical protein ABPG77_006201 [Micractinium sp. CCAP 211/92]